MKGKRLFAVICANGLGHFRRSIEVLHALSGLEPGLRLEIACGRWQRDRMRDWGPLRELEASDRVNWTADLVEPGVRWSSDPGEYEDGRLLGWARRLEAVDGFREADLVLSDNLSGVLNARPDAILMGSFLWSDVLERAYPDRPAVAEFVAAERALLERHSPPMLCVGAMAMPGVLARTRAVPLPWMRSAAGRPDLTRPRPLRAHPKVAILIGATGAADPLAAGAAAALLALGASLALPKGVYEGLAGRPGVSPFGFTEKEFLDCDIALCRPGLGSIHDCIYYGLPMVLAQETGNFELEHNGAVIEGLGLGVYLGTLRAPGEIAARVLELARSGEPERIRARMRETRLDGIGHAAAWLQDRLSRL